MTLAALFQEEPPQTLHKSGSAAKMQPFRTTSERDTLCIACSKPDIILQKGDIDFRDQVALHYQSHESDINEGLIALKKKLRTVHDSSFWSIATSGLGELLGAQYAFICKRLDDNDKGEPVVYGQAGSCLLGMSVYVQDGSGVGQSSEAVQVPAHGAPCEYMKHNKVLLIPENFSSVITNNPNKLPSQPEAYIAAPLSYVPSGEAQEKVFGHFGLMWTVEGIEKKLLSFSQIENILHSLEDLFVSRFYEFGHLDQPRRSIADSVLSANITTALAPKNLNSSSFKPYARSLSHELRTPMQGVVGMLDLMYAAVQEASEGSPDAQTLSVFRMLKENIEEVHDSARRAVEAADNVVHAYDMNMGVPDAPAYNNEEDELPIRRAILTASLAVDSNMSDSSSPPQPSRKRRSRDENTDHAVYKVPRLDQSYQTTPAESPWKSREHGLLDSPLMTPAGSASTPYFEGTSASSHLSLERTIAPGVRSTIISDILQSIINDVVKIGGRPESAIAHPIDGGEEIEVHHRSKGGEDKVRTVRWSIDESVPESIIVDERDLAGLLSRVLHNAFKFTESGSIDTTVRLSPKGKYILINVTDTGQGIPKAFMPSLFKPFSKEDDSITRQSEGLGLGLMVAKGLARRLNGDLYAIRSDTEGEHRGTEFEMRIPLRHGDTISQSSTPYGSPSPSVRSISIEAEPSLSIVPINLTVKSPQSQFRPQLKRGGPRHHRNGSLLSRNTMAPSAFATYSHVSTNLSAHMMPTPPTTASPMPPVHTTSQPRASPPTVAPRRNSHLRKTPPYRQAGEKLAAVLPLAFLVVEDNSLLRKVLVHMLRNLGYTRIHEAYDGADAIRQMEDHRSRHLAGLVSYEIDFVLMDLWMPNMNGYSAAEHILQNASTSIGAHTDGGNPANHKMGWKLPIIMAVTADVTDEAMESVHRSGMKGPLTKPYKQIDLERTLVELCGIPLAPPTAIAGS